MPIKKLAATKYEVNPECIVSIATLSEQMKSVTATQVKLVEAIFGNSKPGIRDQVEDQAMEIHGITDAIKLLTADREAEAKLRQSETIARAIETGVRQKEAELREKETVLREAEKVERDKDKRKWWIGLGLAITTGLFAIITTILSNADLVNLIDVTHRLVNTPHP